jgi:hypothetical protein
MLRVDKKEKKIKNQAKYVEENWNQANQEKYEKWRMEWRPKKVKAH